MSVRSEKVLGLCDTAGSKAWVATSFASRSAVFVRILLLRRMSLLLGGHELAGSGPVLPTVHAAQDEMRQATANVHSMCKSRSGMHHCSAASSTQRSYGKESYPR